MKKCNKFSLMLDLDGEGGDVAGEEAEGFVEVEEVGFVGGVVADDLELLFGEELEAFEEDLVFDRKHPDAVGG